MLTATIYYIQQCTITRKAEGRFFHSLTHETKRLIKINKDWVVVVSVHPLTPFTTGMWAM